MSAGSVEPAASRLRRSPRPSAPDRPRSTRCARGAPAARRGGGHRSIRPSPTARVCDRDHDHFRSGEKKRRRSRPRREPRRTRHSRDGSGRIGPSPIDDRDGDPGARNEKGVLEIVCGGAAGAMESFAERPDREAILRPLADVARLAQPRTAATASARRCVRRRRRGAYPPGTRASRRGPVPRAEPRLTGSNHKCMQSWSEVSRMSATHHRGSGVIAGACERGRGRKLGSTDRRTVLPLAGGPDGPVSPRSPAFGRRGRRAGEFERLRLRPLGPAEASPRQGSFSSPPRPAAVADCAQWNWARR